MDKPSDIVTIDPAQNGKEAKKITSKLSGKVIDDVILDPIPFGYERRLIL